MQSAKHSKQTTDHTDFNLSRHGILQRLTPELFSVLMEVEKDEKKVHVGL